MTSRGTTPPPRYLYEPQTTYRVNQPTYYPTSYSTREQPTSPILPATRYQTPPVVTTVRYQTPPIAIHPTTTSSSEFVVHQTNPQTNATTTTKTSTRILDAKTLPGLHEDSFIEETRTTTTVIRPIEVPPAPAVVSSITTTTVPQVTTVAPTVETTTIRERPAYRSRRRRSVSTVSISSSSTSTTRSSTSYTTASTITPRQHIIKQHTVLPPRPPIETTIINEYPKEVVPQRRIIRQVRRVRTYSGYYSSDLEHGKRKIYKSDYKYRHYYYCNWFKGRCDLPNRSCGCCEWFYGCPVWGWILTAFLFLALLVTFFTLLGLQPTINSARRSETAQTRLTNRTQIIYGYLQNCGYQVGTPTTLALCANTQTTSTSRVILSPSITTLTGARSFSSNEMLIVFSCLYSFFYVRIDWWIERIQVVYHWTFSSPDRDEQQQHVPVLCLHCWENKEKSNSP